MQAHVVVTVLNIPKEVLASLWLSPIFFFSTIHILEQLEMTVF